jgi:hypothetical protein
VAALLPIIILAQADHCNDILKANGAFNSVIKTSSRSADEQLFEWLKTATWTEFKQKQDAGLNVVLPVDGIPVGIDGHYSEDQYKMFTELRDQGKIRFFTEQEFSQSIERTASKEIADKWIQCIGDTIGKGLMCRIALDDGLQDGTIVFHAIYHPDSEDSKQPTIQSFTLVNGKILDIPDPMAANGKVLFGGISATIQRQGKKQVTMTLHTDKGACEPQVAAEVPPSVPAPVLKIDKFPAVSSAAEHPIARSSVPSGYKVIGGGALANWVEPGSLLIASYPSNNSWIAQSKSHVLGSLATMTAWAIGLYDPKDEWDVRIESASVAYQAYARQSVTATLPEGYTMTGGGGVTSPEEPGILLTASYPSSNRGWTVNAQDHSVAATGQLTAYVIGVRPRSGTAPLGKVAAQVSAVQPHPAGGVEIPANYILTGGGAQTSCPAAGNLLTASFPYTFTSWRGEAKDHIVSCPSSITVYAIGVLPTPGSEVGFGASVTPSFLNPTFTGLNALVAGVIAPRVQSLIVGAPERRYITRTGDTLRSVALKFYDDRDWRRILNANRETVRDPSKIPPGTSLIVPSK